MFNKWIHTQFVNSKWIPGIEPSLTLALYWILISYEHPITLKLTRGHVCSLTINNVKDKDIQIYTKVIISISPCAW
jgi:uncharacterized protein YbcI